MFVFLLMISCFIQAAPPSTIPLKVETSEPQKSTQSNDDFDKDSVDPKDTLQKPTPLGIWSKGPKAALSLGYFADQESIEKSKNNRFFVGASLRFLDRSWHRVALEGLWIQNNSVFLSGSWEYVPSRKPLRNYYGLGVAHKLVSSKEFRNLVELENYFVTASFGTEYLLQSTQALGAEIKGLLGTEAYAVQLSLRYIISF